MTLYGPPTRSPLALKIPELLTMAVFVVPDGRCKIVIVVPVAGLPMGPVIFPRIADEVSLASAVPLAPKPAELQVRALPF